MIYMIIDEIYSIVFLVCILSFFSTLDMLLLGDYLINNMILGTLSHFCSSVVNQDSRAIQWLWLSIQGWTVLI